MRRSRIAVVVTALLLPLGGLGFLGASAANATTSFAMCTQGISPNLCMNRAGGGTANGTAVISYTKDFDNNEDFTLQPLSTDCGGTVHNGEQGMTCPFAVGTGLNQRYDGQPIYLLLSPSANKCATAGNDTLVTLQPCNDSGVAWVRSAANYFINPYMSNRCFNGGCNGMGLGTNRPEFLCSVGTVSSRLYVPPTGNAGYCQWFFSIP